MILVKFHIFVTAEDDAIAKSFFRSTHVDAEFIAGKAGIELFPFHTQAPGANLIHQFGLFV